MIPLLLKFLMLMKLMMLCICLPPLIIQFTHQTITSTDASCLPPLIIQFTHQTITSTDASCLPPLIIQFTHQTITSTDASCLPPLIIQFTHQTITSTDASCLPPLIIQFLQRMLHVKVTILIMIQLQLLFRSVNSELGIICTDKICLFYRPPSSSLDTLLHSLISLRPSYSHFLLIISDFNVNIYTPSHHLFTHLSNIMHSFSLLLVVPSYTHVVPNSL